MMKLQLWTTDDTGQANEFLGEVDVDDETWVYVQTDGADALELMRALADEVGTD